MRSFILADLHLEVTVTGGEKESRFISFLNAIESECDSLYILGDLFSYWFEHPKIDLASKNKSLKALKVFSGKGKKVYFVRGNRDFTVGAEFMRLSGIKNISDELKISSGSQRIILTHGDFLAKRDIRYQIWRRFIRSPVAAFVFKSLPMSSAVKFADKCRSIGKNRPEKSAEVAFMIAEEAKKRLLNDEADTLIAGHAHYSFENSFTVNGKKKRIIILDEFSFPGEYLTLKSGEFSYLNYS